MKPACRLHGPAVDGFRPKYLRAATTAHCAAKHRSPDCTANGVKVPLRSAHIWDGEVFVSRDAEGAMVNP